MSTDAQTLSADMPVDAALRRLGRLCEERAKQSDLEAQPDRRIVWRFGQQTAVNLAQWTRRLPATLAGRITAAHLCAGLSVLAVEHKGDTQERQAHRLVLSLYLSLLREAAVAPVEDLYVAGTLWAFLQRMALLSAVSIEEPRSREAQERVQQARSAIMRLRENFIVDLSEIVVAGAAQVLGLSGAAPPAEVAQASGEADKDAPAAEPAPGA